MSTEKAAYRYRTILEARERIRALEAKYEELLRQATFCEENRQEAEARVAEWGSHHFDVHTECGFDASLDYLTSAARGEKRKAHIVTARRSAEDQECGT